MQWYIRRRRWVVVLAAVLLLAALCAAQNYALESTITLADAAIVARKFNRARSLYERALAQGAHFDGDAAHARNLATAFLSSSPPDLVNGMKWLRLAVELDPSAEGLRSQLAGFLLLSGNAEGAVTHYRVLADAHPESTEYVLALARALQAAGRTDAALDLLRRTVESYPRLVPFRVEYARRLNFEKRFAEAKQQFDAALAIEPENVIAQVGAAKAISFEGDQGTALVLYHRILQRHPGLYDAIVGKAFSLIWSGRSAEARPLLEQAVRRHPDDKEVRQALASLKAPPLQPDSNRLSGRNPEPGTQPAAASPTQPQPPPEEPGSPAREPSVTMATKAAYPYPQEQGPDQQRTGMLPRSRIPGYLAVLGLIAVVALPRLFRRRAGSVEAAEPQMPASHNLPLFEENADSDEEQESGSPGSSADQWSAELCPSQAASDDVVSPCMQNANPLNSSVRMPARSAGNVLLVGGSEHLVELESRWLGARNRTPVLHPEWIPAIVLLLHVSVELIVVNPNTEDGWTSSRIFNWIVANLPQFRERTLVVTNDTMLAECPLADGAHRLFEPFGEKEWIAGLDSVLQVTPPAQIMAGPLPS